MVGAGGFVVRVGRTEGLAGERDGLGDAVRVREGEGEGDAEAEGEAVGGVVEGSTAPASTTGVDGGTTSTGAFSWLGPVARTATQATRITSRVAAAAMNE